MSKKNDEQTVEDLRKELLAEKEKSDRLQRENEDRQRKADEKARADAAELERVRATANTEPSEEQWVKLEEEYGATREQIRGQWKLARNVVAPIAAELATYKAKENASEAVRAAKAAAIASDAQFPKYEAHVDEYLADVSLSEKANPVALAKHMDRAINYAQGKARKAGTFRDTERHETIHDGMTQEQKDDAKAGFGSHEIAGIPLTIDVKKLVPDDFRKRHAHPEKEGAVRMDERGRWNDGVPVKPR